MRMYYVIGVLITLFLASCGEPPMPPSDEEMIRHFATHEAAFRKWGAYTLSPLLTIGC